MQEPNQEKQPLKSIIDEQLTSEEKINTLVSYISHLEERLSITNRVLDKMNQNQEAIIEHQTITNDSISKLIEAIDSHSKHLEIHDKNLEVTSNYLATHDQHLESLGKHLDFHDQHLELIDKQLETL